MKELSKKSERYIYLDILKIIAAFSIVFYHTGRVDVGDFVNGIYFPTFTRVLFNLNVISIPVFFMVNGALIMKKEYSTEKIYMKAAKVALLLFVWSFTDFPSWFFKTLIVIYLLYPFLLKIYKNKKARAILEAIVFLFPFAYNFAIVILMRFSPDLSISLLGKTIALDSVPIRTGAFTMYSLLYVFIGATLSKKKMNPIYAFLLFVAGIALVTWDGTVLSNYSAEVFDSVNGSFPTIGALIAATGLFMLIKSIKTDNEKAVKCCSYLGSRVLYTYLFHLIIIKRFVYIYILTSQENNAFIVIAVSLLVYIAAMIAGIILEKIPYVNYLVKI